MIFFTPVVAGLFQPVLKTTQSKVIYEKTLLEYFTSANSLFAYC
jgi:hypothetical protein